jgi:hypothetical protein
VVAIGPRRGDGRHDTLPLTRKDQAVNKLTAAALSVIWFLPLVASPTAAEDAAKPPTELYVRTVPTGATIVVDGKKVGVSDSLFKIEPGVKKTSSNSKVTSPVVKK